MVHDLSITESTLVEAWVAAPLFGANVILFFLVVSVLVQRDPRNSLTARYLLVVTTTQLVLCTGHIATLLAKIVHAFVQLADIPGATETYLADFTMPLHAAEQALYTMNDIIAGGVLTWRCYVVFDHKWRPCAPLILASLGTAVTGIGSIATLCTLPPGFGTFFSAPLQPWLTAFWLFSALTQLGATSLLSYKIYSATAWRTRAEWALIRVFVEAGIVYSLGTLTVLVLYLFRTAAGTIVAGMLGQLSATAPYLIIVRAEAQRAHNIATYVTPRRDLSIDVPRSPTRRLDFGQRHESLALGKLQQAASSGPELPPGW
ncbi:hypothetical protein K488DRAFT_85146 [Vararia minispora EC-137]|uniref:Uncharacterized protein n=1 Tax=Vararia minispora EC-137 TaxID=1314806 RepID=A0ACB8QNW2_9AGAM|nr:hypothetical protein K488DRAFT_85146 [Vararia minispora EC-137]